MSKNKIEKLCCFCKHWDCNHMQGCGEAYGYSEETWSEGSFRIECRKGVYDLDGSFSTEDFRKTILKGKNCELFELVDIDEI